ncbi:hypothetical protein I6N90_21615 [Paenibacillus sp. GSMTC-2017]|uniref:hypothetical protein n=1 Tax=Paenibacillus sp. GSMTC-2017 TaxID=2794350 RepID=UPI0018D861F4|nr:hypothetical protein [Paenibacillus sp. GSMTC-2017]MBH5320395.1 hypothetical protein [Paenibacillus sp. GSMTC-2017]
MNRFKKFILPVTFLFALSAAVPASAAPGQWDYIGEETVYTVGDVWNSGGGNWKVTADPYNTRCVKIELWEYDPFDPNDKVGTATLCAGQHKVFNVSGFVDGGNQAELFIKKTTYTNLPSNFIYHD